MTHSLAAPDATMLAFPLTGTTTCDESGHHRTWHADEFFFVSAVDLRNNQLVHGDRHCKHHFFAASQIGYILATDTHHNRVLLENFQTHEIQWILQGEPGRIPDTTFMEQFKRELTKRAVAQLPLEETTLLS